MKEQSFPTIAFSNVHVPADFVCCSSSTCTERNRCLRALAWAHQPADALTVPTLAAGRQAGGPQCAYLRTAVPQRMARGFNSLLRNMLPDVARHFRRICVEHFGQSAYYLRRRGEHILLPGEQAFIARAARMAGYEGEVTFDNYEMLPDWR